MEVVRRPVDEIVWRGPLPPPNVTDQLRRLMLRRTPGRIRNDLRNVIGTRSSSQAGAPVRALWNSRTNSSVRPEPTAAPTGPIPVTEAAHSSSQAALVAT